MTGKSTSESGSAVATFRSKSSGIVARLLGDFPIHNDDGFAIVGNLGHESAGFSALQEISPTVKGSRGGWGWAQWTGPRRRAFEAYCKRNGLDPASDQANYAWLYLELKGSEAKAIPAVLDVDGTRTKVEAFERAFLRAGVKHYDSRLTWARIAESQWGIDGQEPAPMPAERQRDILLDEAGAGKQRSGSAVKKAGGTGAGTLASGGATELSPDFWADLLLIGLFAVLAGVTAWLLWRAWRERATAKRLIGASLNLVGGGNGA